MGYTRGGGAVINIVGLAGNELGDRESPQDYTAGLVGAVLCAEPLQGTSQTSLYRNPWGRGRTGPHQVRYLTAARIQEALLYSSHERLSMTSVRSGLQTWRLARVRFFSG